MIMYKIIGYELAYFAPRVRIMMVGIRICVYVFNIKLIIVIMLVLEFSNNNRKYISLYLLLSVLIVKCIYMNRH